MQVQTTIPHWDSLIHEATPNPSFKDCFTVSIIPNKHINLDELVYRCFANFTKGWVEKLFILRDTLVKPFGLKTSGKEKPVFDFNKRIEKGGNVGFFEVIDLNSEELLLYADDSHLEAYLSISVNQTDNKSIIQVTTTANTRNRFGQIYLSIIKPFHKLIIRNMLRHVANHYTSK